MLGAAPLCGDTLKPISRSPEGAEERLDCGLFSWRWGSTSLGMSQQALTHTHCRHTQARWGD